MAEITLPHSAPDIHFSPIGEMPGFCLFRRVLAEDPWVLIYRSTRTPPFPE